jgi:acetyltransferase-like isoleucine patch superfamily enzyme
MIRLLEKIVQKRNPQFRFDNRISTVMLFSFVYLQFWNFVRGLQWLIYFKSPKMSLIGRKLRIYNAARITFGKHLKIGDYVQMSALGSEGIVLGNNVSIGSFSRLIVSTSMHDMGKGIILGNNVGLGEFAYLGGAGGLEIGDHTIIGQYLSCHPENHVTTNIDELIRLQGVERKGIKIGKNCWIGSKVTILDGVTIGDGCIIAAGAVVTKSFESNAVIGGIPAKLIKLRT